jgi:hypothetical protein
VLEYLLLILGVRAAVLSLISIMGAYKHIFNNAETFLMFVMLNAIFCGHCRLLC